jgi:hypothetical protein
MYALDEACTGTFTGRLELPDGTVIEPTRKSFEVSTIARWRDGKIVRSTSCTTTPASCSSSASPEAT